MGKTNNHMAPSYTKGAIKEHLIFSFSVTVVTNYYSQWPIGTQIYGITVWRSEVLK